MESNARFVLGARVADATADPVVFHFQRDLFDTQPAQVIISRNAWQLLGPAQAAGYIIDRYLIENPEEEQRVGREVVTYCVRHALGLVDGT
ncbi:hypothetical protein [Hymenobacter volaticus]|uniref:Uncharacterized protein n=1 Tax=Hymenobacter volaticus TaxID=2932254 RepID=A0ABY4GFK3_9BACT|nr:hypothetical protein [Hymenobacter volaticus]UOQ69556.1 hypothetical protein MUN86_28360 [Hymenobacter volaticus]